MRVLRLLTLLLGLLAACADEPSAVPLDEPQARPPDRDTWWNEATLRGAGQEKILAPRELRALLDTGRARGFNRDAAWWERRAAWAYERILSMDAEDVEANAGAGRQTLQSMEGFDDVWARMIDTRTPTPEITELLDRYGGWVLEKRPIFLSQTEFEVETAHMRAAARHLDRIASDPAYAGLQIALRHVRTSFHADYPFLHVQAGPFLVFYSARDLQRDPEADEAADEARIEGRREYYRKRLAVWLGTYEAMLDDIAKRYPLLWAKYRPEPGTVFPQWVFGERAWYVDFQARIRRDDEEAPYRTGFVHHATGWAYLVEPAESEQNPPGEAGAAPHRTPKPEAVLEETAAYLGAIQLLRHWARDAADPTVNHMDRSEDYWFKEGWPCLLAGNRLEEPRIGEPFRAGGRKAWELPALESIVGRRSRIDRTEGLRPVGGGWETLPPPDGGYSDLAWLLVRHLDATRREALERFLIAQVEGTRRGIEWFEECFEVRDTAAWRSLERAVYKRIDQE